MPTAASPPPYPRRFGWPMRIFLTLFLAAITYRCFAALAPMSDWHERYGVKMYPTRLSTVAELAEESRKATDKNPYPVAEDFLYTGDSVWDYWKPWPGAETRRRIHSCGDGAAVAACWVHGHLAFVEHLCGINENWPMFSPSVSGVNYHTRARLVYEVDRDDEGSERVVRQTVEPEDYGHYSHWFVERVVNYETRVDDDDAKACYGWCNYLAHRYPRNTRGTPLAKIVLFQVKVYYPPPGTDPRAHYAEQNRRTVSPPRLPGSCRSDPARSAPQVQPDFYEFDVAGRKGRMLEDEK
jgi:hypothetical protein